MSNFFKRCISGITLRDFVPPVCGKISSKFRNFFHLTPPKKREGHFQYLPTDYSPDFVLDIGAATGYTAFTALQAFDSIPVHCIEPLESNFEILKKSIALFPERAFAYNQALSDSNGLLEINLTNSPYSNSLFDLPEQYKKDNPHIQIVGKQLVKVETLDSFAERIHFQGKGLVKLDVEGAELQVLQGGNDFLRNHVSAIVIELAFNRGYEKIYQVMKELENAGFVLKNIFDINYGSDMSLAQIDAVYVKESDA